MSNHLFFSTLSWLTKIDNFKFEYTQRDPSFLPKEYLAAEGETCYFLDGYKHSGIDENMNIQKHIDSAMEQINKELQN
jgi:guanylate cyclase soluble subunit alpha